MTTQAPNSNIIPVAKVLPQPAGTPQGSVASLKGKLTAQNLYNKILFLCQRGLNNRIGFFQVKFMDRRLDNTSTPVLVRGLVIISK